MVTTRPAPFVARARARDRTPLLVRAVGPEHRQCFIEGLARLSEESRYRRFARPMPGYTDQQLRYLTEIDYRDHMAWLAADLSVPGLPGIAVARYVRRRDDPRCAEAAVTVIDDYQGRGIAPLLLGHLADTARANGIERFEGDILGRNYPMLKVARRLGITDFAIVDGVVHFSAPLPPVLPPAA